MLQNTPNSKILLITNNSSYFLLLEDAVVCKLGDGGGSGSSEIRLSRQYTIQGCINAVKAYYPTANGATMSKTCPNKCSCYAEFKMTKWVGTSWQACRFNGGKEYGNTGCGVFKRRGTKLERFLLNNQHTKRKLMNFEIWYM